MIKARLAKKIESRYVTRVVFRLDKPITLKPISIKMIKLGLRGEQ